MSRHLGCPLTSTCQSAGLKCGVRGTHMTPRPFTRHPWRHSRIVLAAAESQDSDNGASDGDLTESQLARLEKAEREAAVLREQLKLAQQIRVVANNTTVGF